MSQIGSGARVFVTGGDAVFNNDDPLPDQTFLTSGSRGPVRFDEVSQVADGTFFVDGKPWTQTDLASYSLDKLQQDTTIETTMTLRLTPQQAEQMVIRITNNNKGLKNIAPSKFELNGQGIILKELSLGKTDKTDRLDNVNINTFGSTIENLNICASSGLTTLNQCSILSSNIYIDKGTVTMSPKITTGSKLKITADSITINFDQHQALPTLDLKTLNQDQIYFNNLVFAAYNSLYNNKGKTLTIPTLTMMGFKIFGIDEPKCTLTLHLSPILMNLGDDEYVKRISDQRINLNFQN